MMLGRVLHYRFLAAVLFAYPRILDWIRGPTGSARVGIVAVLAVTTRRQARAIIPFLIMVIVTELIAGVTGIEGTAVRGEGELLQLIVPTDRKLQRGVSMRRSCPTRMRQTAILLTRRGQIEIHSSDYIMRRTMDFFAARKYSLTGVRNRCLDP